ncbi:hypothetical protein EDB85DRAFT_2276447 [Lactarius pseudohatsudake]|nr:hypothetical protein EDB85DRAFT_2276447 [Lactarius pseudohatsudake]
MPCISACLSSGELAETSADNLQAHENSESMHSGLPLYRGPDSLLSGFSKIPCVISAFAECGDIIVADRGISFTIHKGFWKGLEISRSTIRWFDHNDLKSLEDRDVFLTVEKECRKRRGPLTRRFIITEGQNMYRLVLDESISFGTVGRTGRGLTKLYNVTRINGTPFVFSAAAVPALLAVSASEGIKLLRNTPSILSTLQENVRAIRAVLDRVEAITIPSHAATPVIHIHLRSSAPVASVSAKPSNPATPAPREASSFDIVGGRLLQDIVDEALAQGGVWTARAHRLRGQELVEAQTSMRLTVKAGLSRKDLPQVQVDATVSLSQ